jgi:uncharacterized membrane protein YkvA (DUF1232 family)
MLKRFKQQARHLKKETYALYLSYRDPRVPWYAKAFVALVVAYALSPIDLIPDFVPVLGYLDDLIIIPLGIYLALKIIPGEVMQQARQQANIAENEGRIQSRSGVFIIVTIWVIGAAMLGLFVYRYFTN